LLRSILPVKDFGLSATDHRHTAHHASLRLQKVALFPPMLCVTRLDRIVGDLSMDAWRRNILMSVDRPLPCLLMVVEEILAIDEEGSSI